MTSRLARWASSLVAALVVLAAPAVRADDWPQHRGSDQGHSPLLGLPLTWSETENVAFKTRVPGRGHSSPIVVAGKVWLTTALDEELSLRLLAFDARSGAQVHDIELFQPEAWQPDHPENSHASPTPAAGGGRVYAHFGTYGTAAVDAASGEILWRVRNTPQEHEVGPGSSPIFAPRDVTGAAQDLVIVHCDATDTQAVVALDAASGAIAWRTERFMPERNPAHRKAFSIPQLVVYAGKPQLVSTGAAHTSAYDPATGEELWRARHDGYSNVPTPVVGLGFAWVNTGYMKPELLAVRIDGSGDVTDTHVIWRYHWQVPSNPSPLLVQRRLFMVSDWGIATLLEPLSGTEIWRERLGGRHWASPLTAEGRIYVWSADGTTRVLAASDTYALLAENVLDGKINATPALADDAIFLRTDRSLYRIEAETAPVAQEAEAGER